MANIENQNEYTLVSGTSGDDKIYNSFRKNGVTIDAGSGNDFIYNNQGDYLSISGGNGDDTIENEGGDSIKISAGSGDDSIENYGGSHVTIDAGDGDNKIRNYNTNIYGDSSFLTDISIKSGTGSDSIHNSGYGASVTIDAGAGSDYISNHSDISSISAGAGDDSVWNSGVNVTINAGAGDDSIRLYDGNGLLYVYNSGDGNDTILGFRADSTLQIGGGTGTFSTQVSGDDVIVTVGDGKIILQGAASLDAVNINTPVNPLVKELIALTYGNDSLNNSVDSALIRALGGADNVSNYGASVLIDGGADNDNIYNRASNVSIDAGAGNDSVSMMYDLVYNTETDTYDVVSPENVTINGGAGNDTIYNSGSNNVFIYKAGDGNDIITGFNDKCTLKIGGGTGTCSVQFSGNNVIVAVGEGSIILKGAASLNNLNIDGYDPSFIKLTEGDDNYTNNVDGLKIFGLGGDDTIINSGASLLINGGTDNDFIDNYGSDVSIRGGDGDDFLVNRGAVGYDPDTQDYTKEYQPDNVIIVAGNGNDTVDNEGNKITIDGGDGDDYVYNNGKNVSIVGGAGLDSIYNSGANVTVYGGDDNDSIISAGNNVTIIGSTGNDRITLDTAATGNVIQYADGDGKDIVYGFNTTSTLQIGSGYGSYSTTKSSSNIIVTVGKGKITLSGAASLSTVNIAGKEVDPTRLTLTNSNASPVTLAAEIITADASARTKAIKITGNVLDNSIVGGTGNDTLAGGAGNDTFAYTAGNDIITDYASGDKISLGSSISSASLNGSDVVLTTGTGKITVKDAKGKELALIVTGKELTTVISDAVTYDETSAAKVTVPSGIEFVDASARTTAIRITANKVANSIVGGKGNDTVLAGAGDDTVYGGAGNDDIGGGADNDLLYGCEGNDSLVGNVGNDTLTGGNGSDVFYHTTGDGNDIIADYAAGEIICVTGAAVDNVSVSGSNVVLNVGTGKITVLDGKDKTVNYYDNKGKHTYSGKVSKLITLTAGDDTYSNTLAGATINALGGNDSIKNTAVSVSVVGGTGKDSITNTKTKVTIDGGTGNDRIVNSAASITITGGKGSDLISLGANAKNNLIIYKDGDGSDTIRGFNTTSTLSIGDGKADTYYSKPQGDDVIISVGDSKITLTGAASLSTLNIAGTYYNPSLIVGTSGADTIANSLSGATINALGGNDSIKNTAASVSVVGGTGKDSITNTKTKVTIDGGTGNDRIVNSAASITITGGKGSDLISLGANAKNNLIIYKDGDGSDTIRGFNTTSTLSIGDGKTDTYYSKPQGDDVIISVGEGKITLTGAASLSTLNIAGKEIIPTLQVITNDDANPLTLNASVVTADASARTKAIKITGNAKANSIVGGSGKDTLGGGKGNDTLTGNGGNDVFIYNAGNDVITDYAEGDTISVASGTATVTEDGNDLILNVGNGSISVAGGKGKTVTYVDAGGSHTYPAPDNDDGVVIDGNTARLTDYTKDSYSIADSLNVTTIDASAITYDLELVGNKKANSILGGIGNDTILGGTGNDYLTGGDGSDVFLYNGGDGNDLITDYTEEDALRINAAISRIAMTTNGTVVFYVDGGRISVAGGANKIIAYEDADGKKHFYPVDFNDEGTAATLLAAYNKDDFDVADYPDYEGTLKTINASAVTHDLTIIANKLANKILGGAGNDTLIGGKGNDNLTGGKGADVFFYNIGDGDDVITDYTSGKDKIQINLKDISTVLSSATTVDDDIVFKIGEGSITIKDGKEQLITLVDANGKEHFCPDEVKFSDDGATVSLLANYSKDTFDIADYPDYATSVKMINATAVVHDLTITGNSKANKIYGSQTNADSINGAAGDDMLNGSNGDDTLNGGKGNDTLYGGEGNDTFEYTSGDGNDVIADYQAVDVIRITGITEGVWCKDEGDDVIINLGSTNNTIAIRNAARDKTTVTYYVNDRLHAYGGSNDLLIDDNYSADAAQLTNIVEPVKANYVPYDFDAGFDLTRNEIPISYQLKANS